MKTHDIPKSGKAGKVIVSRNHYGQYEREYVCPKDPRTPKQLSWRKASAKASKAWGKADRAAAAGLVRGRGQRRPQLAPVMGQTKAHRAKAYFVKVNARRLFEGQGLKLAAGALAGIFHTPHDSPTGRSRRRQSAHSFRSEEAPTDVGDYLSVKYSG